MADIPVPPELNGQSNIDKATGTTLEQRRYLRRGKKKAKQRAELGVRSMVTTAAYRANYDRVFGG